MATYTPTPTRLRAPDQPDEVKLPSTIGQGPRYDFFRRNSPQMWLPEVYLAQGEASLEPFFETLKILMVARPPFDNRIRSFCHRLWEFYNVDEAGIQLKKLQESERSAQFEKNIYHVEVDGNLYRRATEDDVSKRRKVISSGNENEPDEVNNTLCSLSPFTALSPEDPATPPSYRADSSAPIPQNRALSPGSPTVRQMPLTDVFETSSSTEEDITGQQAAALASLSQQVLWVVDGVDLLSKFNNFKNQQPQPRLSLALDGIADVSSGSGFSLSLSQKERMLASAVTGKSIDQKWPSISSILSRVCASSRSYDDVVKALRNEDPNEVIVDYLRDITYHYSHYLKFSDEVPRSVNEREGFGDLTWPFIRGALTLANIQSRCFEIPVMGTKERKNHGRDLSVETEEQASMADGVALFGDHQIYLAEASLIHEPKLDKQVKDKFKVARCMRDSWNSQIRSIAREAMPPAGLSVFGSTSFGDETKFYVMDFAGTYRLKQVGRMLVPLSKAHFASRMEMCVRCCLRFAIDLQDEIDRRSNLVSTLEDLTTACDMIVQTRTTPTKEAKKRRVSGIY